MKSELEYCALCEFTIHLDSYAEEYRWIDGLGYLCDNCMNLEEFSSPEDRFEVDEDINDLLEDFK